ncbi:MAG: hypothetical protein ACLFMO_01215 [Eubacteriales bacterium]
MPGRDGTGPVGLGFGRGRERGRGRGLGRGLGLGLGPCSNIYTTEKKLLEKQKVQLENTLDAIKKQLKNS